MGNRKCRGEYKITLSLYGFPAYVVDNLLNQGLHGKSKEGVVERILFRWIEENLSSLEGRGINMADAKRNGYIPIKARKT